MVGECLYSHEHDLPFIPPLTPKTVIRGMDLASRDSNGFSDPYCVLRLTSGGGTKRTHIIKKTLNPAWDEVIDMGPLERKERCSCSLNLVCWDFDLLSSDGEINLIRESIKTICLTGREDFEGQFTINLDSFVGCDGARKRAWFALMPRPSKCQEPVTGAIELELLVMKATAAAEYVRDAHTSVSSSSWTKLFGSKPVKAKEPEESEEPTFNVELGELMERQKNDHPSLLIPVVCDQMLQVLHDRGTEEEGIFRIAGVHGVIAKLASDIDAGKSVDLTQQDIHNVSGLFKKFLRELPTPLLSYHIYDTIVANEEISFEDENFLELLRKEVNELPPVNYHLLHRLMELIHTISNNSEKTKMSLQNLMIVIAPNLLWDKEQTIYSNMSMINRCSALVSMLIMQYAFIFKFKGTEDTSNRPKPSAIDQLADEARTLFTSYDTNGDGDLQVDEFRVFYKDFMNMCYNEIPSEAEIMGAIIEMDEDKNGEIDIEEFTSWWKRVNASKEKQPPPKKFVLYAGFPPPPCLPTRGSSSSSIQRTAKTARPDADPYRSYSTVEDNNRRLPPPAPPRGGRGRYRAGSRPVPPSAGAPPGATPPGAVPPGVPRPAPPPRMRAQTTNSAPPRPAPPPRQGSSPTQDRPIPQKPHPPPRRDSIPIQPIPYKRGTSMKLEPQQPPPQLPPRVPQRPTTMIRVRSEVNSTHYQE